MDIDHDFDMRNERDESGLIRHRINGRPQSRLDAYYIDADLLNLTQKYKEHVILICEAINRRFALLPASCPRLRAHPDVAIESARVWVSKFGTVKKAMRGQGRQMYPEGINTAITLWETLYLKRRSHIVAYGGTNLGKTSCADFLRLLTVTLNFLCLDKSTCVLNILVPRNTLISQAKASLQALRDLYGLLIIENCDTGKTLSLDDAYQRVVSEVTGIEDHVSPDSLNFSRAKKEIEKRIVQAMRKKMELLTLIDEIHFGPLKSGRLGQHAKAIIPGLEDEVSISTKLSEEHLEMLRITARNVVAFSATPVTELQSPWKRVPMEFSPHYASAYLYFMGERIANNQIPVWGMTDLYRTSHIDLRDIIPSKLNTPSDISRREAPDPAKQEAAYRKVVKALRWFYREGRKHGGAADDWHGTFVRLHNNNPDADRLSDYIEHHTRGEIEVVRYFRSKKVGAETAETEDNGDIDQNIRDQVERRVKKGVKFCVIATAMCRMADDLPKQVCFFLDFTRKSTFDVALRQGTAGRAGGHDKKSLVVMSDYNARKIAEDNNFLGWPDKRPGPHTHIAEAQPRAGRRSTRKVQIKITVDSVTYLPPEIRNAVEVINIHLRNMIKQQIGFVPTKYQQVRDSNGKVVNRYLKNDLRKVPYETRTFMFSRRTTVGLPTLDVLFGPHLPMLESLAVEQNNVETAELLGFNGDQMPNYTPQGLGRPSYADQPYSLRDIEVLNETSRTQTAHGINSAKAWGRSGMLVQFVWTLRNGVLEIGEVFWPAKSIKDKINTNVHIAPNDDVFQSAIRPEEA